MPDDELHRADNGRRFGDMPIEEMDRSQRAVNDWLVEYLHPERAGTGATIGGPVSAMLHSPGLAELTGRMVPFFFDGLSVPRAAAELAMLLTARHWSCHFMFHTHRRYAAKAGIGPAVVDAIAAGARPELDGEMSDVHDFVAQLLRDGDISDVAFKRLSGRWGQRGAVEVVATVGFYSMLALVLNVDRYPVPDEGGRMLPAVGNGRPGASSGEARRDG